MKIKDLRTNDGVVSGFRIGASALSRSGCQKVIRTIPGVRIVRAHKAFRIFGSRDDFCEFVVEGKTFLAIDLYGENMEFWIVQEEPERDCPPLAQVREAFLRGRKFFGLLPATT